MVHNPVLRHVALQMPCTALAGMRCMSVAGGCLVMCVGGTCVCEGNLVSLLHQLP